MRGLPLPPAGVIALRWVFSNDGAVASSTNYIAAPGSDVASAGQLETLRADLVAGLLDFTSALTHSGCAVVRVDLERYTPLPIRLSGNPATNNGAWDSDSVSFASSTVAWLTGQGGRGSTGRTCMPGFPQQFTDDGVNLNDTGRTNISDAGIAWVNYVNTVAGPSGDLCVHGVLSRVDDGAPLAVAEFRPTLAVRAGLQVGFLDRRRTTRV